MKKNTLKFLAVVLVVVVAFSSCATKKKYGCPNHISLSKLLGL